MPLTTVHEGNEPETLDEYVDDDIVVPPPRRRMVTGLSWFLGAALVAAAGFAGGVVLERHKLPATASATRAAGAGRGFGGAAGASGASGVTGPSGVTGGGATTAGGRGGTVGTVQLVDGNNVYIQDTQGNTIKVTLASGGTVTVAKAGALSDLQPGATVRVTGTTGANDTMQATSISDLGALGGGGFGGGGFGGGPPAGVTGASGATGG